MEAGEPIFVRSADSRERFAASMRTPHRDLLQGRLYKTGHFVFKLFSIVSSNLSASKQKKKSTRFPKPVQSGRARHAALKAGFRLVPSSAAGQDGKRRFRHSEECGIFPTPLAGKKQEKFSGGGRARRSRLSLQPSPNRSAPRPLPGGE